MSDHDLRNRAPERQLSHSASEMNNEWTDYAGEGPAHARAWRMRDLAETRERALSQLADEQMRVVEQIMECDRELLARLAKV